MKLTSYKFWYIQRNDNVHISKAAIRFYEGTKSVQIVKDIDGEKSVDRDRVEKRLQKSDLPQFKNRAIVKEYSGDDCFIYTPKDFGVITTDDELRVFLNGEIKKDKNHNPIAEQS